MISLSRVIREGPLRLAIRLRRLISGRLVDPRDFQPALPLPGGLTRQQIHDILGAVRIDGSTKGELLGYASADLERFLHTLSLIPDGASGSALEIGANPYFTTLLVKHFRPSLNLSLLNCFGPGVFTATQTVSYPGFQGSEESLPLEFQNANIESDVLPYADASFDYLLFCEVLEHMTNDPVKAVLELKRVLKPGGLMILTTPNAARLENVIALMEGGNIYDPFSAYGPYGRHNREYTRHELHLLMTHCGFESDVGFTANVYPDRPSHQVSSKTLNVAISQVRNRENDLGQYLFTRWRNVGQTNAKLPSWLYRSYPAERMSPT